MIVDLRLDVHATAGVNAVLSGIFLDEIAKPATGGVTDAPRTPGYWKNWKNQYTLDQFTALLNQAKAASGPVFPSSMTVSQAESLLGTNATVMATKLNSMFLAMLLNQSAGVLRSNAVVNLDLVSGAPALLGGHTITVGALITKIENAYTGLNSSGTPTYNGWTSKQQELVKNVCEAIDHFGHHDAQDLNIIIG